MSINKGSKVYKTFAQSPETIKSNLRLRARALKVKARALKVKANKGVKA
jgi:hypothetical protein